MSQPATNVAEFTVSELSIALKRTVEDNFELVRVRGEVSGFKGTAGSGHCYFRLKDERACLEAVVWRTTLQRLRFKPQEGLEMVATGKLTTYPGRSSYQIVIERLEPAGAGALMALLEERRKALQAEGLFDAARKKPLPYLPRIIGVVTSPTGAVIRDILHRLRDRFPSHVLVWPVRVQGDGAAEEVAAAVRGFNALAPGGPVPRPDLIIVARGGGSVEDLWAFNEEAAVRAVAASAIPTIAAVGHETDWTLIDHAADRRAPTPTGAAEMAVPVRWELQAAIRDLAARHDLSHRRALEARRRDYLALCRALPSLDSLLGLRRQRLDDVAGRLWRAQGSVRQGAAHRFGQVSGRLRQSLGMEVVRKRERLAGPAARLSPLILARAQAQRGERLGGASDRLARSLRLQVVRKRERLAGPAARLSPLILARAQAQRGERLGSAAVRLRQGVGAHLRQAERDGRRVGERLGAGLLARVLLRQRERYGQVCRLFQTLSDTVSPDAILARGFALVLDAGGAPVRSASAVSPGDGLTLRLADGEVAAVAGEPAATGSRPRRSRQAAKPARAQSEAIQDSLF